VKGQLEQSNKKLDFEDQPDIEYMREKRLSEMENRRQASAKRYQHKKVLRAKEAVRRSVEREKEETIR